MVSTAGSTTGQSRRGRARRQALIDAAAALLVEQGFAAVSHRTIASRAAVPLAATTYYFASLDDVVDEAMQQVADQWLNRAEAALSDISPRLTTDSAVADAVLRVVTASGATYRRDADLLVMYERYLEAGRQPRLRQMVARYDRQLDRLVQQVLIRADLPADLATARLVLAQMDGVTLRALAENRPVRAQARAALRRLLTLLRNDPQMSQRVRGTGRAHRVDAKEGRVHLPP